MTGKLFVIEGLDGSGKQTQTQMLFDRLQKEDYNIRQVSFPNYDSPSSALVKMYLKGDFGKDPEAISPYISSTFFAADRYATYKTEYEKFYQNDGIVLADRYTTSNMVHQASKIADSKEKEQYLNWLWNFEFCLYGIPAPTQVFFLDITPQVALSWMENRRNKFTDAKDKDIHESNENHLVTSYQNANYLIDKYQWEKISCIDNDQIKSIEEIHELIYISILKYL